jgi:ADP-ribosylglycohydrolase
MAIVKQLSSEYSSEIIQYIDMSDSDSLEVFDLDEGLNPKETNKIGFTLKAMGAGFWALKHAVSYRDGILQVIHEGGDADTNAAVAGALLGARYGLKGIPNELVLDLQGGSAMEERATRLYALLRSS